VQRASQCWFVIVSNARLSCVSDVDEHYVNVNHQCPLFSMNPSINFDN